MAYVTIPKDLTKVKSKVLFGLTKRQLICFGAAALIGVPLFFLLRRTASNSAAAFCIHQLQTGISEKKGRCQWQKIRLWNIYPK